MILKDTCGFSDDNEHSSDGVLRILCQHHYNKTRIGQFILIKKNTAQEILCMLISNKTKHGISLLQQTRLLVKCQVKEVHDLDFDLTEQSAICRSYY